MSSAEHDLVAQMYASYNTRDLDAWLNGFAPDAVWVNVPTAQTYVGRAGQVENYEAHNTPFPRGQVENLVIHAGDGFVAAEFYGVGVHEGPLATPNGEIPPTGRSTRIPFCDIHEIKDGKVISTRRYWDLLGANASLGI